MRCSEGLVQATVLVQRRPGFRAESHTRPADVQLADRRSCMKADPVVAVLYGLFGDLLQLIPRSGTEESEECQLHFSTIQIYIGRDPLNARPCNAIVPCPRMGRTLMRSCCNRTISFSPPLGPPLCGSNDLVNVPSSALALGVEDQSHNKPADDNSRQRFSLHHAAHKSTYP